MPRTRIPEHLIHRKQDVKRDAERFDHLCELAEEISFPIVKEALLRETAATCAEVLTEEAKNALQTLAEDAGNLLNLDEEEVLEAVQRSFREQLPAVDEQECHQHARDLSQILVSIWLESLRTAHVKNSVLMLSDYLLPQDTPNGLMRFVDWFCMTKSKLPEAFSDAVSTFAVNGEDIANIMATLRVKLFTEPLLVDLPFDLAMISAPEKPVLLMTRPLYDHLVETIRIHFQKHKGVSPVDFDNGYAVLDKPRPAAPYFSTATARRAINNLTEPLSPRRYACVVKVASPGLQTETLQTQVMNAFS
jgi:hypothetical protein